MVFTVQVKAQEPSIKETEARLKNLHGLDKLIALNILTAHYHEEGSRKALRYGRHAVTIGESIFDESNTIADRKEHYRLIQAYTQLGTVLYEKEHYIDAKRQLEEAESLAQKISYTQYDQQIAKYLSAIQRLIDEGEVKESFFDKALGNLKVGEAINKTSMDMKISTEVKIARSKEKRNDFDGAIIHYKKAINLLKDQGDSERISKLQLKIALLLDSLNDHIESQRFLDEAITAIDTSKDNRVPNEQKVFDDLIIDEYEGEEDTVDFTVQKTKLKNLKDLSEQYARKNEYEKSLAYFKMYQELAQKVETDSLKAEIENRQKANEIFLLKQQKKIADLNVKTAQIEKDKQIRLRNTSILAALIALFGGIGVFYFYQSKRKEHQKLTVAYEDLNQTKGKLEKAEKHIVKLLSQQVSGGVAMKLLSGKAETPVERRFVCIMFLDIRGFTPKAEKMSPEELIAFQNRVFGFMIDIIEQNHGTINQLLGDGFMATFGAPESHGNDCQNAYDSSRKILEELQNRIEEGLIQQTRVGIGLHAGYVVTGNVGTDRRKQYSVTGNPVIIASRVEQLNKKYNSQFILTEEVYSKLVATAELTPEFIGVQVKGRSKPVKIMTVA